VYFLSNYTLLSHPFNLYCLLSFNYLALFLSISYLLTLLCLVNHTLSTHDPCFGCLLSCHILCLFDPDLLSPSLFLLQVSNHSFLLLLSSPSVSSTLSSSWQDHLRTSTHYLYPFHSAVSLQSSQGYYRLLHLLHHLSLIELSSYGNSPDVADAAYCSWVTCHRSRLHTASELRGTSLSWCSRHQQCSLRLSASTPTLSSG